MTDCTFENNIAVAGKDIASEGLSVRLARLLILLAHWLVVCHSRSTLYSGLQRADW
jgi:hypothetical protein